MDPSQQFPPNPNPSVDGISDFLKDFSTSAPDRQPLTYGASSYGYLPPAMDYSRARFPIPAYPPLTPAPRRRPSTNTSSSTAPSTTFDVGSYPNSSYTVPSYTDSIHSVPTTITEATGSTLMPGDGGYILLCEFVGYGTCDERFDPAGTEQWIEHIIVDHLQNQLPNKSNCWFCDNHDFDARRDRLDKMTSFRNRLEHVRSHILDDGHSAYDMRPDFDLVAHLWKLRLIPQRVYDEAQRYREGPRTRVTGIYPHDFIPEEQIQQHEQSQRVVVSEPRESERSHRQRNSREDTGHRHKSRKSSAK